MGGGGKFEGSEISAGNKVPPPVGVSRGAEKGEFPGGGGRERIY